MLYTVHTNFTARDENTGLSRLFARTDRIEADDKLEAKSIAWKTILDSGDYAFLTYESQNARLSHRK